MDKDIEVRLTRIRTERDMIADLQLKILEASEEIALHEMLQDKSSAYKEAWKAAWCWTDEWQAERHKIVSNIFNEYGKREQKVLDEYFSRDYDYYRKQDALRRRVAATIREGVQTLFR